MDKVTQPTSSEIGVLWTAYMNDSMSNLILNYFLKTVEDTEIKEVILYAINLTVKHQEYIIRLFNNEGLPVPKAFNQNDVRLDAPRLLSDPFMLMYINHMSKAGHFAYSGFISMCARDDLIDFFSTGLKETNELYKKSITSLKKKGLYIRSPYISVKSEPEMVKDKSYLSGFQIFTKQRPVNTIEISHLYTNIQTNLIGAMLSLAFAQTSPNKEVQKFMLRGKDISQKHIKIFTSALMDSNVQAPNTWDNSVTNETTQVFSDKLMMFHMSLLAATGIGNYATAAAASQRSDLALNYERLSLEIALFAKDGADIMLKYNWLEEPPGMVNKTVLAKEKKEETH
jgi:hypothetical protein